MKTHLLALTAIFLLLTATSCQKKPSASFSTDKEVYSIHERAHLSSASTGAYYYTWIVKGPANEEIRGSEEDFSFDLSQIGTYDITLCVYSKNGKEVSKVSKTISVTSNEGNVIFYTNRSGNTLSYYITDNGSAYGWFYPRASTQVPACGSSDCYTFTGNAGMRKVFTVSNTLTGGYQTYTITIGAGTCQTQAVNF